MVKEKEGGEGGGGRGGWLVGLVRARGRRSIITCT